MRRSYRGNIANEMNMLGWYFNRGICDEVLYRNWRVSLNILLERIPGYCELEY